MVARRSGNPNDFCLPDLGEGLEEAELIEWVVHVGQRVEENDMLAKMETAKALVEVPSPRAGTIVELHGKPGESIKVGAPLVTFRDESEAPIELEVSRSTATGGNGNKAGAETSAPQRDAGTVVGSLMEDEEHGKVRAAPAVRRLARDLGVEIDSVHGTGIGGRVTRADVEAVVGQQQPAQAIAAPAKPKPQPAPPTRAAQPVTRSSADAGDALRIPLRVT